MQDGYYFATSPWLIGDPELAAAEQDGDHSGLRRGQVVRIAADAEIAAAQVLDPETELPLMLQDQDVIAEPAALPVLLRPADRSDGQAVMPRPEEAESGTAPSTTVATGLIADLIRHQYQALDRIAQLQRDGLAGLEDRIVAGLAAMVDLILPQSVQAERLDAALTRIAKDGAGQGEAMIDFARAFDCLAAKVDATPRQNEQLLRDIADLRAGLTELRVQGRMIELQLYALGRGTDNPLARPPLTEMFGAKADALVS